MTTIPPSPKRITVLGSTGSIGCNTIKLLKNNSESYQAVTLTAHSNVALLAEQAKTLKAERAVIAEPHLYNDLKTLLAGTGIRAAAGREALIEAASVPSDWIMAAIVGVAGLEPTLAAIRQGTTVALANKECLVSAGALMMEEVRRSKCTLIPVDSEHSAIFQVFDTAQTDKVEKVTLTASGGPFRTWEKAAMARVTPEQAVNHPNWQMGAKISVDSATMMNKGLELIEAFHLFPVAENQIEILVHPESVVHSMVAYKDGSVLAQLGTPDMCTPIAVALAWPERMATDTPRLDLAAIGRLTFEPVDMVKFPAVALARQALVAGGALPAVLNAANEIAVAAFLAGKLDFLGIASVVEQVMAGAENSSPVSVEEVIALDKEMRVRAEELIRRQATAAALLAGRG